MDSINNIYKSFTTLKDMLTDQGCDIENLHSTTNADLQTLHINTDIFQILVNDCTKVIYYMNNKFKIVELRKFIQPADNAHIKNIIIIFKEKINNFNPKNIEELSQINLQVFLIKELMFNISKHIMVPKHEVIRDPQEVNELVEMYNLKTKLQFPIILKTDPMARYLNVQSGDLVRVTRISPTSGENILYRCCV